MNSYRKSDRKVEFRSEISIVLYRNFGLGRLWAKSPAILNEILLRRDSIPQLIDSLSYKSIRTQIFSSLFVVAMLKVQVVCLPRPIQKLTSFLLSLGEVGSPGGRERSGGCGAHVPFPSWCEGRSGQRRVGVVEHALPPGDPPRLPGAAVRDVRAGAPRGLLLRARIRHAPRAGRDAPRLSAGRRVLRTLHLPTRRSGAHEDARIGAKRWRGFGSALSWARICKAANSI